MSTDVVALIERQREIFQDTGELPADRDFREAVYWAALDVAEGTAHLVDMLDAVGIKDGQQHAQAALAKLHKVLSGDA